jgi:hypothetical protein
MNLEETARLHALKLKQLNNRGHSMADSDVVDLFANDPAYAEAMKSQTKNICAHISVQLFKEVDGLCELLGLSKRRFVELALIDAIDKTSKVIHEVDPFAAEEVN